MDVINRAFMEVMTEGDADGRVFTFPIPTYNITPDFNWDTPNVDRLFDMTAKYGLPYFQNFINSDLDPHMIRSMCCRLQLDLRELLKRGNGLFGSAELTGSIGVVTVNMARLGYLHPGNEEALIAELDHLIDLASDTLEKKRATIQHHMDGGLFPYTRRYLGHTDDPFAALEAQEVLQGKYTGGTVLHLYMGERMSSGAACKEMVRNFSGDEYDITDPRGFDMCVRVLDHIRERMVQLQEATGHMYNLEATPAEGTTYRFAKEDARRYQ